MTKRYPYVAVMALVSIMLCGCSRSLPDRAAIVAGAQRILLNPLADLIDKGASISWILGAAIGIRKHGEVLVAIQRIRELAIIEVNSVPLNWPAGVEFL